MFLTALWILQLTQDGTDLFEAGNPLKSIKANKMTDVQRSVAQKLIESLI